MFTIYCLRYLQFSLNLLYRLYKEGKSVGDSAMAADPALELPRIMQALKSFVGLLSQSDAQPEFRSIQVPPPFVPLPDLDVV